MSESSVQHMIGLQSQYGVRGTKRLRRQRDRDGQERSIRIMGKSHKAIFVQLENQQKILVIAGLFSAMLERLGIEANQLQCKTNLEQGCDRIVHAKSFIVIPRNGDAGDLGGPAAAKKRARCTQQNQGECTRQLLRSFICLV